MLKNKHKNEIVGSSADSRSPTKRWSRPSPSALKCIALHASAAGSSARPLCAEMKYKPLKRIIQEDSSGCGLACIAMLAKTSYKNVKKIALKKLEFSPSGPFYTDTNDLRKLAKHFGIELGQKRVPVKCLDRLPKLAILAINYQKRKNTWHWVLYVKEENDKFVYDPKKTIKTEKRRDFGRMKPRWYVLVKST